MCDAAFKFLLLSTDLWTDEKLQFILTHADFLNVSQEKQQSGSIFAHTWSSQLNINFARDYWGEN